MENWSREGVPHKGWRCIDVYDLTEEIDEGDNIEYESCDMCGNEKIRYVHVMKHPEYTEELHVGCVCAEKMTDDYVNPRKCETALRNKALRRKNFNKVQWRYNSLKNTYSKKYKGEYITIVKSKYGNWGVFFAGNQVWKYKERKMNSMDEANYVAFEIFEEFHTTKEEREWAYYQNRF